MKWFKCDRLKAEVSSVLPVKFPVADAEATLQLRSWTGILFKVFFIHIGQQSPIYKESRMKELNTQLYIMYIMEGKSVLCVFDKLSCPLRAEMLNCFIKRY